MKAPCQECYGFVDLCKPHYEEYIHEPHTAHKLHIYCYRSFKRPPGTWVLVSGARGNINDKNPRQNADGSWTFIAYDLNGDPVPTSGKTKTESILNYMEHFAP